MNIFIMTAIITQARVNSSRLPNKIFKKAKNISFLEHHIARLKETGLKIIVATTNDGSEKPILDFCKKNCLDFYRGDENNVLKRFYECAKEFGVTTIIRVTSDCPLIDGQIIKNALKKFKSYDNDNVYYSNCLIRSYPRGMDYEIFSFKLLENAFFNAEELSDLEHVTPYIWNNRSENVRRKNDVCETDSSDLRITLDTSEDQLLISTLIENFDADTLNCAGMIKVLRGHPDLVEINKTIEQKKI